jgi:hypothetical protein
MPKTYEYNGEIFTHEDMLEAYGDDTGVEQAVKEFGIKETSDNEQEIPKEPGKKKTVAVKDANATVQKSGASKQVTGSSGLLIPGVNDFGARITGKANQQGFDFKQSGQTLEYRKQQEKKIQAEKEQQAIDKAEMEVKYAASAERFRKKSDAHAKFLQVTKPKQEQLSEIENEIKNELDKNGKFTERMVYPRSEFQVPYAIKEKYNAFAAEKSEVIAELKKNKTLDRYNDDAILNLAVEKYRKKKITSIYDNNAKDFMEDVSDEEQEQLRKASEEASKDASKQINYHILVNQRVDRNVKEGIIKLNGLSEGLKKYTKDYKFKSKEEYDEYKVKVSEYNDLRNTVTGLQSIQQENLKKLDKSKEKLKTAEEEFDIFKRHYGYSNLILKPVAAFAQLGGDMLGFVGLTSDVLTAPERYIYSKIVGDDEFEFATDFSKTIAKKNIAFEESVESYFPKKLEITDAESLGEYSFDLVANQIPNLLLMYASGGGTAAARVAAGEIAAKTATEQVTKSSLKKVADWTLNKMALDPSLQLMAAGSAGSKYLENVRSNDIGETNYNPIQMVASSLLWGYAEALGEKVTVDILKGSGRTLEALLKGETNFVQKTLKQKSVDFFKNKGIDFVNENLSEQATNLVQNSVDNFILGKNVGLLDNTGLVFKDTSILTLLLQFSPHVAGAAIKPFLPKDETSTIKDNALKIAKYMNLLKDDNLSFEESTALEKKIKDLTDQSSSIMKTLVKRIGDMPASDYNRVINLSKEIADLKVQATNIYNSESSNKEELIKDLKEKHDSKKTELNKLVQETKILSKLDGNYTVQEKRDLYDLEIQAIEIRREIEGKEGAEVLDKKERLKQIEEKQKNIAINSFINTQTKGIDAINEVLKSKGLSGIQVINVNTPQEAIDQHDKIVDQLLELGELTEKEATTQKSLFLQTIQSAEAAQTNIKNNDYIFNIKERIDNEAVFSHEPGHSILDRLISKNPEDFKDIHDALLDYVKTLFGTSKNKNENDALKYILAGVKAYQQHAIDTNQEYAYDELLQVVGDALQKYNIGMESIDPNFLQRLAEKIKEFLRKVLKIQNVDDVVKFNTGKDVYDFIKEYRRTFRKGELSKGVKAALEKGSVEGKLVKKSKVVKETKPKADVVIKASLDFDLTSKFPKLTNSKEYIDFKEKLKNSTLYHYGSESINRTVKEDETNFVWFYVDYIDENSENDPDSFGDGIMYQAKVSDLKNTIILPDINDVTSFHDIIKEKYPKATKQIIKNNKDGDFYPGIKEIIKTDEADEILSDWINWSSKEGNIEYDLGFESIYDGKKVAKSLPVVVVGKMDFYDVDKLKNERKLTTKPSLQIKSKNPIELKRKTQILKDFVDNRLPSFLLGKETGDKADALLLKKIKGFFTISKNNLKYSNIDTSELESYFFDLAKSVRDQEFTTKEIQTKLAEDFELDLSKSRLNAISEQDIQSKIEEILEEDKTRKDKQLEDLSEDDIRNLAIEIVSAEKVFTSSYVLKKGSRRGKKMEQSQFDREIKMFKADLNRLAYLLGERFHKTDILKKIAIGSGGIFDSTSYEQFSSKFRFKKVINDKRLKSIDDYKAVGIEPMKNNIGKIISDFFDKRQKINNIDIDSASYNAVMKEFKTETQKTLSDFTGEQRVAIDKRRQEIADELIKKRQVDTNTSVDLTLAEKVELGNNIKEALSKVLSKSNEDSIKDAGAYFFETLFNEYLDSEDKLSYLRFISTIMSLMSSNGTAISRQLAFPRFFSITPGFFIKTSKRTGKQSAQQFHYEHPLKSITFLSNMLDNIKRSSSIEEFKSKYDQLIKNYHGFVMNKNDQQIFDADGYTTYSPEFKGNELPISDYSYKVGKDYDVLYIEPSGRVVSLDDFYKTEMFKKEVNESIDDAINSTVKPSLRIVSDYIQENKPRKIPTNIALDLLDELHRGVENYWGKVSDENVGVMYQNIEYAVEIVNEREEDKNPIMKAVNEGLNLVTVKDTERRLNDIISDVSVKASLSFNKLVLQDEKRELIKINTDIASKYKSGQTKSEEDQTTINNNIARVREINDFLNKPEGESIKGVSEKNQKISEKNNALLKIFKDPKTDQRSKEKLKMDLLGNNMGIIVNLVKRYWSYQQEETAFTKDDLKEELILQFFNMLNTYDPVKNPNFGAYIGGYLPKRIPRILENIGTIKTKAGEERIFGDTLSDEGAKQLSEEEENEYVEEVKAKKKRLSEALNISQGVLDEINKTAIRTLGGRIADVTSNEFKTQIRQNIRADLRNVLNRDFGISMQYASYLNKNWKILYDAIPLSVMNKRFQEFRKPVLDADGKQLEEQIRKEGKSWKLKVWKKADISKEDFYGYFLGQYVGASTRGTRKTALLETIAEELSFDVMIDLFTNNEEFKARFEEKQELLGNQLAPNYLSEIAKQLDRDTPNTKASLWGKKFFEDNNLSKEQGINILEQISDNLSKGNEAESVFDKFRKAFPDFIQFIDYFYNKVKNLLIQNKIDKSRAEAIKFNKSLLEKSKKFTKDQIQKMTSEDLNEQIDKINIDRQRELIKPSLSLSGRFNQILEEKSGVPAKKKLSEASAYVEGRGKGRWKFFIPPNTEDFTGLLYTFLPFGKEGENAMNFFHDNLIQPFYDAMNSYDKEQMQMVKDYKELKKLFNMKNSYLRSTIPNMNYTVDQAIRLWIWHLQGEDIQGIPEAELKKILSFVRKDKQLKMYAKELSKITKRKGGYVKYDKDWLGGTISTDIIDYLNSERRAHHLELWQQNVDEIFNNENLNKIQAIYGLNYRRALVNSLARMKSGKNRIVTADTESSAWLDFINGANANIMFFNTRSALLQLTSMLNYLDLEINNPVNAGKAFANQPQFWKDFLMLWNEDYLVQRRGGARFDVSADEIAAQASGKDGFKKLLAKLSEAGFSPTKYADSISAAMGGASFYRTHYNHYVNIGYSEEEAHNQSILDWAERTETTNQSARPDKISQIQSTSIGRLIFAFGNTSMQYNRLMKRAFLDIANKRGDWRKNAGKIIYYGAINNMIFSFLQNALFTSMFGSDDDDEKNIYEDQSLASTVDGILDSILKGSGIYGALLSTAKNMWQKWYEMELSGRKNPYEVPLEILSISPAISSKVNKLISANRTFIYKQEREKMVEKGWAISNPAYGAAAKVLSVTTNIPADRIFQKIENIRLASDSSLETWKRTMLLLGYNKYNLDIEDKEEPIDVLSKSDRKTFEEYKKIEPNLTEEQYMEMKDLEPKIRPGRKNKKTWLNIFNPNLDIEMEKDPLTKPQRKKFESFKQIEPSLTLKDFIEMNNINIREGSDVDDFEKASKELEQIKEQEKEIINIKNTEE